MTEGVECHWDMVDIPKSHRLARASAKVVVFSINPSTAPFM